MPLIQYVELNLNVTENLISQNLNVKNSFTCYITDTLNNEHFSEAFIFTLCKEGVPEMFLFCNLTQTQLMTVFLNGLKGHVLTENGSSVLPFYTSCEVSNDKCRNFSLSFQISKHFD